MITASQMRAARALLGIDQKTLAEMAGLSVPTIQRMEASDGNVRGVVDSLTKVVDALTQAGIELIGESAQSIAGGRGHCDVCGSASEIADIMEEWFRVGAADGFNVMPPVMPGGLDDFVGLVIPELQRRGLFRREYEGRTLRENLGLARPASRYAARA